MNPFVYSTSTGYAFTIWSPGLVVVMALMVLAALYPKDAQDAAYALVVFMQLELMNLRLYVMQRRMHHKLSKDMKKHWGVELPPFKFVRIQDRGRQ